MSEQKYTAAQVEEAIAAYRGTYESPYGNGSWEISYDNGDGTVNWNELHYEGKDVPTPIGVVKVVESEGGGEGDGDHAHLVIQLKSTGQFFRVDGYYQSFDGLYLDGDLHEVRAVEKTVVVYE